MWVLPVECNPALHPRQRLIRLAARDQHSGDGMAVPRGDPGPSGEGDVSREVFLRKVDRTQKLAPMPEKILRFVAQRFTRRWFGRGCNLEARLDLSLECGQPGLVERLGRVLLDLVTESVGVVVHPRKQYRSRLVRLGPRRLPGFDPSANEFAGELSKIAARIVEFLGLLIASGEESLVKCGSADRVGAGELPDPGGDLFQLAHERVAGLIGNEHPWFERQFHLALDRIRTEPRLSFHPPFPCPDPLEFGTAFSSAISPSVYPGAGFSELGTRRPRGVCARCRTRCRRRR